MGNPKFYKLTNNVCKALDKVCKDCEVTEYSNVKGRNQTLIDICEKQDKSMKIKLADLNDEVTRVKEDFKKTTLDDVYSGKESIKQCVAEVENQFETMKQKQVGLQSALGEKSTKNKKMMECFSDLKQKDECSMKYKSHVALYTNITQIRWVYDSEPDEVKGIIKKGKDFKSFSLNTKDCSQYFIANYLWDQIGN